MRSTALLLGLGVAACSTTHSLPDPARLPSPQGACSIGVASLMDQDGVDLALDLRDYLRVHGPCRRVTAVVSPEDDGVDVVITGKVTAQLKPGAPPGLILGAGTLGAGLGLALSGAILYGVPALLPPKPDSKGFVDPSSRATQKTMEGLGVVGLGVGGGLSVAGLALMIIDGQLIREVSLDGSIDVEVRLLRQGRPVAELHEHDDVTARGSHPGDQPESRSLPAASGPLYREVMAHVFEHIAERAADEIQAGDHGQGPR